MMCGIRRCGCGRLLCVVVCCLLGVVDAAVVRYALFVVRCALSVVRCCLLFARCCCLLRVVACCFGVCW